MLLKTPIIRNLAQALKWLHVQAGLRIALTVAIVTGFGGANAFGQQLELGFQINSGFSRFGGDAAARSTGMHYSVGSVPSTGVNNRFGKQLATIHGASVQLQQVNPSKVIAGLQLGYDALRSKIAVNEFRSYNYPDQTFESAEGSYEYKYTFVNVQPYVGYRFEIENLDTDIVLGTEVAQCVYTSQALHATNGSGRAFKYESNYYGSVLDIRLRGGVTTYYKKYGLSFTYAHGIANYNTGAKGGREEDAFMRVLRLGFIYKIK